MLRKADVGWCDILVSAHGNSCGGQAPAEGVVCANPEDVFTKRGRHTNIDKRLRGKRDRLGAEVDIQVFGFYLPTARDRDFDASSECPTGFGLRGIDGECRRRSLGMRNIGLRFTVSDTAGQ